MSLQQTIAIIGGGASGVALAAKMVEALPVGPSTADLSIALFDARGAGGGNAYAADLPTNLMNTTCGAIDRAYGGAYGLLQWARQNPGEWQPHVKQADLESGTYLPRPLVGAYLRDLLRHAGQEGAKRGIGLELIEDEVVDIARTDGPDPDYEIFTRSGARYEARYVYLALGHLPPRKTEAYQHRECYHHTPYPVRGLADRIPSQATVGVIGTRLSAIDVALGLAATGHVGKIHCVSRGGRLPAVRADQGRYEFRELERDDLQRKLKRPRAKLRLSEVAAMLGSEIEHAEGRAVELGDIVNAYRSPIEYYEHEISLAKGRARPWQAVLYATNRNIDLLWHHLEEEDKRLLMSEWLNDWLTYRASIPRENAERILRLMRSGQLTVRGGARDFRYDPGAGTFRIAFRDDTTLQVEHLVAATGSANRIEDADSALVQNLLASGLVAPHRHGGIDCVFETGKVIPRGDGAPDDGRLFALGPITSGVYFFTTALEIIERQASQRCNDLAFMLGVEWLERPEAEAWVDARQAEFTRDDDDATPPLDPGPDLLERLVANDQTDLIDFAQLRLLNDQIRPEDFGPEDFGAGAGQASPEQAGEEAGDAST